MGREGERALSGMGKTVDSFKQRSSQTLRNTWVPKDANPFTHVPGTGQSGFFELGVYFASPGCQLR